MITTEPELAVYKALLELGYKEGADFTFQSSILGGRMELGGIILDFYIPSLGLGINIQGEYWHYKQIGQTATDQIQRAVLEGMGIQMIYIDESDALSNARYYVEQALKGIDHSRMAG